MKRMKIIISNDDGIEAPGIQTLLDILSRHADCRVVAPAGPQSGVGHALTYDRPISVQSLDDQRIAVKGTPADCARLALSPGSPLFKEWAEARRNREVWLVAGINRGANLGMGSLPFRNGRGGTRSMSSRIQFHRDFTVHRTFPIPGLGCLCQAGRAHPAKPACAATPETKLLERQPTPPHR